MKKATICCPIKSDQIQYIEKGIHSIDFLVGEEMSRVLIISAEIFENLVHHAELTGHLLDIRITKSKTISLLFSFQASNFEIPHPDENEVEIYYDSINNRYRGMGLRMCRNLSETIQFKISQNSNFIRIIL